MAFQRHEKIIIAVVAVVALLSAAMSLAVFLWLFWPAQGNGNANPTPPPRGRMSLKDVELVSNSNGVRATKITGKEATILGNGNYVFKKATVWKFDPKGKLKSKEEWEEVEIVWAPPRPITIVTGLRSRAKVDELPEGLRDRLLGVWRSDKAQTTEFNDEKSKLPEKQKALLDQTVGKLTVEFQAGGTMICTMPDHTVRLKGKVFDNKRYVEKTKYKILGYDDHSVVIETESKVLGKLISRLHFVDESTYWIYLSGSITDVHAREYFTKVKKVEGEAE